jgi:hypothetical protein
VHLYEYEYQGGDVVKAGPARIVILEDNADRAAEMRAVLHEFDSKIQISFFDNAMAFCAQLKQIVGGAALISLDHDLGATRNVNGRVVDPGVGRDVSRELAKQRPRCPVIIHSTNVAGAPGMRQDLTDAGWTVSTVVPYGNLTWVREAWLPQVRQYWTRFGPPDPKLAARMLVEGHELTTEEDWPEDAR